MGDSSVAAYENLISLFKHCAAEMKPFTEVRDGLCLEDRLAGNIRIPNRIQSKGDVYQGVDDMLAWATLTAIQQMRRV